MKKPAEAGSVDSVRQRVYDAGVTEGNMNYLVCLDSGSPFGGVVLLAGWATTFKEGNVTHPALLCSALDWDQPPGFVRLTVVPNQGQTEARRFLVPKAAIAFVLEDPPANPGSAPSGPTGGSPFH